MSTDRDREIEGTWDTLRLTPGCLTRLVAEGKATQIRKDVFGRWIYRIKESVLETERKMS